MGGEGITSTATLLVCRPASAAAAGAAAISPPLPPAVVATKEFNIVAWYPNSTRTHKKSTHTKLIVIHNCRARRAIYLLRCRSLPLQEASNKRITQRETMVDCISAGHHDKPLLGCALCLLLVLLFAVWNCCGTWKMRILRICGPIIY